MQTCTIYLGGSSGIAVVGARSRVVERLAMTHPDDPLDFETTQGTVISIRPRHVSRVVASR